MNGTEVSYGLRDDVPVVFSVSPPGTDRIIEVKGKLRDVIKLVNKLGWKIIMGEVDIDAFLERYHSEEKSRPPRDKVTQDRNEAVNGCPRSDLISNYRDLAQYLLGVDYDGRIDLGLWDGSELSEELTPEFAEEVRELVKEKKPEG